MTDLFGVYKAMHLPSFEGTRQKHSQVVLVSTMVTLRTEDSAVELTQLGMHPESVAADLWGFQQSCLLLAF